METFNKDNNLDTKDLLDNLKALQNSLAEINQFSGEQNQYFSEKNQQIDLRMKINNQKSKKYLDLKHTIPELPQNDLLDILSEHVQIHHLKFVLMQEFIEDIYNRFDIIGNKINQVITPLINELETSHKEKNEYT